MILQEKIPQILYEYSITAPEEADLDVPRLVFETAGFKQASISETFEHKQWSLKVFAEKKSDILKLKTSIDRLKLKNVKSKQRSLKPNQWLTLWKNQWKPLSLTKQIDVVPYWYKGRYKSVKKVIFLDTLMSFGTGMHETTQLMAQFIEDHRAKLDSFIDIGTGTGILTLVAMQHGAGAVHAMDISPLSIEAAKSNLKVNGFTASVVLGDVKNLPSKEKYQTVAANLVTEDLLKNKKKIVSLVKPGGLLMVSGISLDNLGKLRNGFRELPLMCRKVSRGREWAAILYVKKMS